MLGATITVDSLYWDYKDGLLFLFVEDAAHEVFNHYDIKHNFAGDMIMHEYPLHKYVVKIDKPIVHHQEPGWGEVFFYKYHDFMFIRLSYESYKGDHEDVQQIITDLNATLEE
jgi:hypothetical protein